MIYEKPPPILTPRQRKERQDNLIIMLTVVLVFILLLASIHILNWLFPSLGIVPTLTLPALSCDAGP